MVSLSAGCGSQGVDIRSDGLRDILQEGANGEFRLIGLVVIVLSAAPVALPEYTPFLRLVGAAPAFKSTMVLPLFRVS